MFYIFQNISEVDGTYSYGFIPEDKIQEDSKQFAFKVIDVLPVVGPELDGIEYKLGYNELEDEFFWEVV